MAKRVLVVAPHPDDESLGCGGTLRRHVVAGHEVRALFLTSGEQGIRGTSPDDAARIREREARSAAEVLGLAGVDFWREPDGRLRASRRLVDRLAAESARQDLIYVTHPGEAHPDHRAAARAVKAAVADRATEVLYFEVWTPLQRLDIINDITEHIDVKRAAIQAHASQCSILGFDEAFVGLARYRGELHSWPGGPYAEVFRTR